MIEDLHKISDADKRRVAQTMKLFMDLGAEYPDLRIIALGARETGGDLLTLDPEMHNRVTQIALMPMKESELTEILVKGERFLNVRFSTRDRNRIVRASCGMPAVTHQLALNMCYEARIVETTPAGPPYRFGAEILPRAETLFLTEHEAQFTPPFDAAIRSERRGKYESYLELVRIIASVPRPLDSSEIHAHIRRIYPAYPRSNLTVCLRRLVEAPEKGRIIVLDRSSQRYRFRDPAMQAYAHFRFAKEKWADYCVSAATWTDSASRRALTLIVLPDEGDFLDDARIQTWQRPQVIDSLLKGEHFVTITTEEGGFFKGRRLYVVRVADEYYLRVDRQAVAEDDLGHLNP